MRTRTHALTSLSPLAPHTGVLACLDGYMNIALENTEVKERERDAEQK